MRQSHITHIHEISGDQFPDLARAQQAARAPLASALADVMRRMMADGLLVNDNGRIIPNPERMQKA